MKKFVIFALMSVMTTALQTQTVSQTEAMQRATEYFNRNVRPAALRSTASVEPSGVTPWMAGDTTCMYAVQMAEGGWVLVSADDRTTSSVLAYSENGTFDTDDMPDGMKWLLGDYARQILYIKRDSTIILKQAPKSEDASALRSTQPQNNGSGSAIYTPGEWLLNLEGEGEILWNQSWVADGSKDSLCELSYNYYCPEASSPELADHCGKCPAGCGPVAMGQIMRYWKWPSHALVPKEQGSTEQQMKAYEWDLMPVQIDAHTSIENAQLCASLLRDIGLVAGTVYGATSSGTDEMDFVRAFGAFSYHIDYSPMEDDCSNLIRNEIDEGRPIVISAYRQDKDGHYFIVDGYKNEAGQIDYFHINWGWGPRNSEEDRTYCLLSALCPREIITIEETFLYDKILYYHIYPECSPIGDKTTVSGAILQDIDVNIQMSHKIDANCVVQSGKLKLQADEVELQPGFEVKEGAALYVTVPSYQYCQTQGPGKK